MTSGFTRRSGMHPCFETTIVGNALVILDVIPLPLYEVSKNRNVWAIFRNAGCPQFYNQPETNPRLFLGQAEKQKRDSRLASPLQFRNWAQGIRHEQSACTTKPGLRACI